MTPVSRPRNIAAITLIATAALKIDPQLHGVLRLAASGPHGAAIAHALHDALAPLAELGRVGMRLAVRIDGARASETDFLGDPTPLGAVAVAAGLELALHAVGEAWSALADDVLAEAERADCDPGDKLPQAEQLAAAALAVLQHVAPEPVLAAMREAGIIGARLAAASREIQQQLRHVRRLRRLFARNSRARLHATADLLAALARVGGIVAEAAAGAAIEAVSMDGLFLELANGLPLPPLPDAPDERPR